MSQPPAEALLISALLNTQDATAGTRFGLTPEHFRGYGEEYTWLLGYHAQYGEAPSIDAFCDRYPDFPFKNHHEVRYAADEVLEEHYKRRFQESAQKGIEAIRRNDVAGAYELMRQTEYVKTSATPKSFTTDASFLDTWDEPMPCIEVPYPTLQSLTGGLRNGNLWYLAARLGQGKSAYLIDIATHALMNGKRVLYYSLEMSDHELRSRTHSIIARRFGHTDFTTTDLLYRNVSREAYKRLLGQMTERITGEMHMHTPVDGPVSPATVASRADEYDLVVIDYATLMQTDGGEAASSDWRTAAQISNRLKQVALAHNVPILAAAQINRDGEHGDLPPKIKNLAQSDALGQDGDVVITMRARTKNVASVFSLEKNRHGRSGVRWYTVFDVNNGVFAEITEDQAEGLVLNAELEGQQ